MKTLKLFIFTIITLICFSLTSCSTYTYAQPAAVEVEIEPTEVTYTTVITYGVPYYIDGIISYYTYRGLFYYPYYWHNHWYVHPYTHVQPHGFIHRPHHGFVPEHRWKRPAHFRHDNNPRHHGTDMYYRPHTRPNVKPDRHHPNVKPKGNRPFVTPNRPNTRHYGYRPSSTRTTVTRGTAPVTRSVTPHRSTVNRGSRVGSAPASRGGSFSGGSRGGRR